MTTVMTAGSRMLELMGRPQRPAAAPASRANQRERTRRAIVQAARELIESGRQVTMPLVAEQALVSEATAYRYFPHLPALIREALNGLWPTAEEAMRDAADLTDPSERVAYAAEQLLERIVRYQGSARAMIAATISNPERISSERPGYRFGLIDQALDPVAEAIEGDHEQLTVLKRRLAVIMSPESVFTLIDFYELPASSAIAAVVETARAVTELATRPKSRDRGRDRRS